MALVCDKKSDQEDPDLEDGEITDDDEDEEITNHNPTATTMGAQPTIPIIGENNESKEHSDSNNSRERSLDRTKISKSSNNNSIRDNKKTTTSRDRRDEKTHRHMTEAERSILHLRKREKQIREREKYLRKDSSLPAAAAASAVDPMDDDFAKNIEKTLATILNKKEKEAGTLSATSEDEEKRSGRKRKNKDDRRMEKSQKNRRMNNESPSARSEIDENEMLNIRSGSPGSEMRLSFIPPPTISRSPSQTEESYNSAASVSSDEREERSRRRSNKHRRKKEQKREKRDREHQQRRVREEQVKSLQETQDICVFYMQGKCQKNDCPYSHEVSPPMKLELCKFYLMDCCAKGDNCSYMHSEFPCKFYHTGLNCSAGKDCKFAHGTPLSEGLKQILFKHIETAPRDILQGFPRLSRDEALNHINQTQKKLLEQFGAQQSGQTSSTLEIGMYKEQQFGVENSNKEKDVAINANILPVVFDKQVPLPKELITSAEKSKSDRKKTSRWQRDSTSPAKEFSSTSTNSKPFNYGSDQDMRMISNGDVDMRTLPAIPSIDNANNHKLDVDIRSFAVGNNNKDVDCRQMPFVVEEKLLIEDKSTENLMELPSTTRDLFARINANQKDNTVKEKELNDENDIEANETEAAKTFDDQNINWYSDDDDDENRLMIKVEDEDLIVQKNVFAAVTDELSVKKSNEEEEEEEDNNIVGKLGDLSKIDISAEVSKLLSSMSQNSTIVGLPSSSESPKHDDLKNSPSSSPKRQPQIRQDPRLRKNSIEMKSNVDNKLSIYEQGGIDMKKTVLDIIDNNEDFHNNKDIDLRNMGLPFKGMQNYTPASEIDASLNSHPPIIWKVFIVDIPRPDYTGLKLSINDAEKTGDPRLKKIFRLSVEEKDSPASPKASPTRQSVNTRVDPRLIRKNEEKQDSPINYNQQLNMLQSSQFYQSLTSNQKLMLNQELAKSDQNNSGAGMIDPILNNLLGSLNLLPNTTHPHTTTTTNPTMVQLGAAASILNNIVKISPLFPTVQVQPGLLGAAPGIPNIPPTNNDYNQMNFDPRGAPGLLGDAPPSSNHFNSHHFGGAAQNMDQPPTFNNEEPPPQFRSGRNFNNNNNNNRDGRRRGNRGNRGHNNNRNNYSNRRGNNNNNNRDNRDRRNNNNNNNNRGHSP